MPIGRIAARDPEDVAQLVPLHDVLVRLTRSVLGPAPRADALELRADRVRRPRRYARRTRQAVVAAVEHAARRGEPHDRADDLAARARDLVPAVLARDVVQLVEAREDLPVALPLAVSLDGLVVEVARVGLVELPLPEIKEFRALLLVVRLGVPLPDARRNALLQLPAGLGIGFFFGKRADVIYVLLYVPYRSFHALAARVRQLSKTGPVRRRMGRYEGFPGQICI